MVKVQVYVYDLTRGMAAALSPMLLGHQIPGVWHTGVVIDGQEIFFGHGIHRARAGTTMFGVPNHIIDVGTTEVPPELREELLSDLAPRFRPEDYSLLWHNCNHFSNEFCQLLTGEGLPDYIMSQAETLFSTPWGESLMPMVMAMEGFTGRATTTGLASPAAAAFAPPGALPTPAAAAAAPAAAPAPAASTAPTPVAPAVGGTSEGSDAADTAPNSSADAEQPAAPGAVQAAGCSSQSEEHVEAAEAITDTTVSGKVAEGMAALQLTADSRQESPAEP